MDAVEAACVVLGELAQRDRPLGALTTYRVGGPAAVLARVRRPADLQVVAAAASASGLPVMVVGRGSNLLVADAGFAGIAVVLDPGDGGTGSGVTDGGGSGDRGSGDRGSGDGGTGDGSSGDRGSGDGSFGGIRIDGLEVRAGAAVPLPALARRTAEAALTGFEWAVGVPGSVGGAVRMNAGGHGSDMAACLLRCRWADLHGNGELVTVPVERLELGYRTSAVTAHHVVVDADIGLAPGDADASRATIREIVRWRRDHQPGGQNAGSVFTNPADDPQGRSAGWYIDAAGLKGRRLNSAMVSPKHANFIQADPGRLGGGCGSADRLGPGCGRRSLRCPAPYRVAPGRFRRGATLDLNGRLIVSISTRETPLPPARPEVDPRMRDRWLATRRQEGRRRLRVMVALAAVAAAGGSGLRGPRLPAVGGVATSQVSGARHETTALLAATAGLAYGRPLLNVDTATSRGPPGAGCPGWPAPRSAGAGPTPSPSTSPNASRWPRSPPAQPVRSGLEAAQALVDATGRVLADRRRAGQRTAQPDWCRPGGRARERGCRYAGADASGSTPSLLALSASRLPRSVRAISEVRVANAGSRRRA